MAVRGRRPSSSLRRRPPTKDPKKRILIVCEGRVTEREYFRDLKRAVRNPLVEVQIARETGVPLTVVQIAVQQKQLADSDARRERDDNLRFDEVWGVFDVDEHPQLNEAQKLAADNGVRLAVSNPCFELWALLHFQDQTAHIERDRLRTVLQQHLPGYDKLLDFGKVHPSHADAVRRALSLDMQAERQREAGRNPTTGVYRLTQVIISG